MKFDTILEYQNIDRELLALENEFSKSKERAVYVAAKSKLESATETVGKLSHEAAELLSNYNKLSARAEELKAKLDEFDGILDGVADVNEADYYIRQIGAISDEIAALERDAAKDGERIDSIGAEYKRRGKSAKSVGRIQGSVRGLQRRRRRNTAESQGIADKARRAERQSADGVYGSVYVPACGEKDPRVRGVQAGVRHLRKVLYGSVGRNAQQTQKSR